MSKHIPSIRLAFTASVALLQVFLQPAVQWLHVGCDHAHQAIVECAPDDGHGEIQHRCCHHHHDDAPPPRDDRDQRDSHHPAPSHDHSNCQICQVTLAARICELAPVQIPVSMLTFARHEAPFCEPEAAPGHLLPARGPPA